MKERERRRRGQQALGVQVNAERSVWKLWLGVGGRQVGGAAGDGPVESRLLHVAADQPYTRGPSGAKAAEALAMNVVPSPGDTASTGSSASSVRPMTRPEAATWNRWRRRLWNGTMAEMQPTRTDHVGWSPAAASDGARV